MGLEVEILIKYRFLLPKVNGGSQLFTIVNDINEEIILFILHIDNDYVERCRIRERREGFLLVFR